MDIYGIIALLTPGLTIEHLWLWFIYELRSMEDTRERDDDDDDAMDEMS